MLWAWKLSGWICRPDICLWIVVWAIQLEVPVVNWILTTSFWARTFTPCTCRTPNASCFISGIHCNFYRLLSWFMNHHIFSWHQSIPSILSIPSIPSIPSPFRQRLSGCLKSCRTADRFPSQRSGMPLRRLGIRQQAALDPPTWSFFKNWNLMKIDQFSSGDDFEPYLRHQRIMLIDDLNTCGSHGLESLEQMGIFWLFFSRCQR